VYSYSIVGVLATQSYQWLQRTKGEKIPVKGEKIPVKGEKIPVKGEKIPVIKVKKKLTIHLLKVIL